MKFACVWMAVSLHGLAQSNPPLLKYATYLPAAAASKVAVDSSGYTYISGVNYYNASFPCTNLLQPSAGSQLSFVTKLLPDGSGALWTTCVPGISAALALDSAGSVYFGVGTTGGSIVAKLSAADGKPIYSVSIGSATINSMASDRAGNIYVTGSAGTGLVTTAGAYKATSSCGANDSNCTQAFVVKLNPAGVVQYATYAAQSGRAYSIAVNSHGEAWIAGTSSPTSVTQPSPLPSGAWTDGYVAKFDTYGRSEPFSLVISGGGLFYKESLSARSLGVALDAQDAAYVIGDTEYEIQTTPGTIEPNRPFLYGPPIGFVMKFNSVGNTVYSTYIGTDFEAPSAVVVDANGNAYLGLPGPRSVDNCFWSQRRITVVNKDASSIFTTGDLGGGVSSLAMDAHGAIYIVGGSSLVFLATPKCLYQPIYR